MAAPSPTLVERPVRTTSPYGKTGSAALAVQSWSDEQRVTRAMKRLAMFWGGALVAMIIPPHWPWLILMGMGGPIAAWLVYRQPGTVQDGRVPCPDCGAEVAVEEQPEAWPLAARCKQCRNIFAIDRAG